MTPILDVFVCGTPRPQPRPRFSRRSGHVYNPDSADQWKALVDQSVRAYVVADATLKRLPSEGPLVAPLRVDMTFYLPRPQRLLTAKSPEREFYHAQKPDRDNLEKAVLDTLTDVGLIGDDCQVCAGEVKKMWPSKNGLAGLHLRVWTLDL